MAPDRRHRVLLAALVAVTGCAFVPRDNVRLDEARSQYARAVDDREVATLAAAELSRAAALLERAGAARGTLQDVAVVDHLAYLAKQRVAIAREVASQRRLAIEPGASVR